jgi:hypothetical protein
MKFVMLQSAINRPVPVNPDHVMWIDVSDQSVPPLITLKFVDGSSLVVTTPPMQLLTIFNDRQVNS